MKRPLSIAIDETKKNIIKEVNSCGLPPCILEEMLRAIYIETKMFAEEERHRDRENLSEECDEDRDQDIATAYAVDCSSEGSRQS